MIQQRVRRALRVAAIGSTLLGTLAAGQGLNIDFNRASGIGAGAPATTFAGAAGQPGWWNAVTPSSAPGGAAYSLTRLGGSNNNDILLRHESSSPADSADYGTGDYEKLMGDYAFGLTQNGRIEMTIEGLLPGFYQVYAYAGLPPSEAMYTQNGQTLEHVHTISVEVNNIPKDSAQASGLPALMGTFQRNANFVRLGAGVPDEGVLKIVANANLANSGAKVCINGVQLVKWPFSRVHVATTAAGDRSGRDWANATDDLQAAIDLAGASNGQLTQVWVKAGAYRPSTADRTASFNLRNAVDVIGGFAGTETDLAQRNLAAGHTSVLTGEINSSSITDNIYTVVRSIDQASAMLDGFTIARGYAYGPGTAGQPGTPMGHNLAGGLVLQNSTPLIRNCLFTNNHGAQAGAVMLHGVMFSDRNGFSNCQFMGNRSGGDGGAVTYWGIHSQFNPSLLKFIRCRFIGNQAVRYGGAMFSWNGHLRISNSLLHANSADTAAACAIVGRLEVNASTVSFNTSPGTGSRIGGLATFDGDIELESSILWGNTQSLVNGQQAQWLDEPGDFKPRRSCVQANMTFPASYQVITADPMFVDPDGGNNAIGDADDDLRLADGSPLIDAADSAMSGLDEFDHDGDGNIIEPLSVDVAGNDRFVDNAAVANTGAGSPIGMDMGCYENQSSGVPPCPADFNQSGDVSVQDIFDFLAAYFSSLTTADFNGSGDVTVQDIFDFLAAYFAGC